jgi:myo-inositol 2-dehydrogenase / D-chiro-inositol 1-dehydrogenase
MRIAMIGTGWIAPQHLDALAQLPSVEIVAVAGRDPSKAAAIATPRKAAAYGDWRVMLDRERPDGVYICMPPAIADATARNCAGLVRGVMVEKPVAADISQAELTAQAFAAAGTIAGAAYHNRARAMAARIRTLAAEQPVVAADAWWHGGMPPPAWWRTRALSGGQMTEQCTHLVDLLRLWLGEAVEVSAIAAQGAMRREVDGFDVDDAVAATIRFASGAVACVHTSCIAKPGQELDGVGMRLRARGWEARLDGWGLDTRIRMAGGSEETLAAEPDIFRRQAEAFVAALTTGDPTQLACSYADGVETLRLTRAIDQAATDGATVHLPRPQKR